MKRSLAVPLGLLLAVVLVAVTHAADQRTAGARADTATPGEFLVTGQSAIFDPGTGQVSFKLIFNRPPDFQTVDSIGRPADAFQYQVIGNPGLLYPRNYDSIIRGDELSLDPSMLRIRNAYPSDPSDPDAHGWGSIRGKVPYQLDGNVLTFSTPLGMISDHSTDGLFSYLLDIVQYGGSTQIFNPLQSIIRPDCLGQPATIVGTDSHAHTPPAFNDELSGDDQLTGTPGRDVIVGLGGKDRIAGLGGNDLICSGAGKDDVQGGKGNDTLKGRKGKDVLHGQSGNDVLKGGDGADVLKGGKGKDRLYGEKGNDKLNGGPGKDKLNGGPGKDKLNGGPGKDKLNGGPGKDTVAK